MSLLSSLPTPQSRPAMLETLHRLSCLCSAKLTPEFLPPLLSCWFPFAPSPLDLPPASLAPTRVLPSLLSLRRVARKVSVWSLVPLAPAPLTGRTQPCHPDAFQLPEPLWEPRGQQLPEPRRRDAIRRLRCRRQMDSLQRPGVLPLWCLCLLPALAVVNMASAGPKASNVPRRHAVPRPAPT